MIEVQDEILSGKPRYQIVDYNGNVIYTNVSVDLVNDVIQEGTPLNKALFDSIKQKMDSNSNKIDNLHFTKSRGNLFPSTNWERTDSDTTYTKYTSYKSINVDGEWNMSVDSVYERSSNYAAYRAVDSDNATYWQSNGDGTNSFFMIESPITIIPTEIYIKGRRLTDQHGKVEAYDDTTSTWDVLIDLHTGSNVNTDLHQTISTSKAYSKFRVITDKSYVTRIDEFQITKGYELIFVKYD